MNPPNAVPVTAAAFEWLEASGYIISGTKKVRPGLNIADLMATYEAIVSNMNKEKESDVNGKHSNGESNLHTGDPDDGESEGSAVLHVEKAKRKDVIEHDEKVLHCSRCTKVALENLSQTIALNEKFDNLAKFLLKFRPPSANSRQEVSPVDNPALQILPIDSPEDLTNFDDLLNPESQDYDEATLQAYLELIESSFKRSAGVKKNVDSMMSKVLTDELARKLNYVTKSKKENLIVGKMHFIKQLESTLASESCGFDKSDVTKYIKVWLQKTSDRVRVAAQKK